MKKEKHRNTAPLFQVEAEPETAQLARENWHGDYELVTQQDDLSPLYWDLCIDHLVGSGNPL